VKAERLIEYREMSIQDYFYIKAYYIALEMHGKTSESDNILFKRKIGIIDD
jgi:hypothetical protein